ncbi:hypothetical protein GZ77_09060 [Endozoicomonas montiporae]|uniref:Uncharacterized protein n=2 Tax=Endozoicomonas montiporae TaxID=1027273 RepID=A0A081N7S1_9GAMM|nr:hypothetical protein [Endozoicomonas montiporae]AMO55645.1 hypothetical protein EZMO1_1477 [Endozoicomonas montiporae CL-33]KEQ14494.1 hypothetical protein GZ77_09060 [Endozoicomonas montiporae]
MSMYPSTGGALINAFNPTLFDSYKSAGWQLLASKLSDKYPELDIPVQLDPNFDKDRLTRVDWATQAGMTAGLLRHQLDPVSYQLLRVRYTHDGNPIKTGNYRLRLAMTDNLRDALQEGWPVIRKGLIDQGLVRGSVLANEKRLQYMALRALRPDIVLQPFQASDDENQRTIDHQQWEVRKAVRQLIDLATKRAEFVLALADLVNHDC